MFALTANLLAKESYGIAC